MSALQQASRCGGARLPFAPLERMLERSIPTITGLNNQLVACSAVREAKVLGVPVRQLYRWRHQGVTWAQADILAIRAGWHPGDVWGRDWWALDED